MLHVIKMFDNYCYVYFCRSVYISAPLSAIVSKLSALSILHKDIQQGSPRSMYVLAEERPLPLYTPCKYL